MEFLFKFCFEDLWSNMARVSWLFITLAFLALNNINAFQRWSSYFPSVVLRIRTSHRKQQHPFTRHVMMMLMTSIPCRKSFLCFFSTNSSQMMRKKLSHSLQSVIDSHSVFKTIFDDDITRLTRCYRESSLFVKRMSILIDNNSLDFAYFLQDFLSSVTNSIEYSKQVSQLCLNFCPEKTSSLFSRIEYLRIRSLSSSRSRMKEH